MNTFLSAFTLGTAAILTNACLLPLYPGLIAFLAGGAGSERSRAVTGVLGAVVLAGVLTAMLAVGAALYALRATFSSVLPVLLPIVYALVIGFGVLLLLGRSPFARLAQAQTPLLRNPLAGAYVYGLMLGPMTLPCTGPIITSAFLLSAGGTQSLADGLLYFLAFGLGFGWPLVVLPLLALPFQRQIVRALAHHKQVLERASGVLLIAVGIFGIVTELLPQVAPDIEITPSGWVFYWLVTAVLVLLTGWLTYRASRAASANTAQSKPLSP